MNKKKMQWEKNRRGEWVCECGVGHPDLDYAKNVAKFDLSSNATWEQKVRAGFIHGCCGCCSREDFPGKRGSKELFEKAERDDAKRRSLKEQTDLLKSICKMQKELALAKKECEATEKALNKLEKTYAPKKSKRVSTRSARV